MVFDQIRSHYHPARIRKVDNNFEKNFDFKDMTFPAKIRDSLKIEKKNCMSISVAGYENKEK